MATILPFFVVGFGADARFFSELTATIDISEGGCSFHLKHEVPRGGIIAVRVMLKEYAKENFSQRPFLYQIARAVKETNCWMVGAAKLQPESIWLVAFPKPNDPKHTA